MDNIQSSLAEIESRITDINHLGTFAELESFQKHLLGKNGQIQELMKLMKDLPSDQRPEFGRRVNEIKVLIEKAIQMRLEKLKELQGDDVSALDYTLPGQQPSRGRLHLLTQTINEILNVFQDLGFHVIEGPDIEDEWHNFEALRLHADHPARDTQDSFYLGKDRLLKTHTSPMQIRYMETHRPPIQMVAPGYCFRRDPFTSRHSPTFFQIEALMVDKGITFPHLKGVLTEFVHGYFGRERVVRFRPDFFPFVEPGCELAVDCSICGGKGCRVCSQSGWIEILGAGMVHPGVLANCDIDPTIYTGFAFGMGVERPALIRYGIDDIRHFYENDFRFLEQF